MATLIYYQQRLRVPFSSHLHQHLILLFVLFITAILTVVKWNRSDVLICISFLAKEVEHFFVYLLAICASSFENCPIQLPFINWVICSFGV
jgi:hypothetical protein